MKWIVLVCAMLVSDFAYAGSNAFRVISETRIEHIYFTGKHQIRTSFGVRFRTNMTDMYNVFLIPRIRYGTALWNIGPEFRIPTSHKQFNGNYILLLKAQFFFPTKEFEKTNDKTFLPASE